MPWVKKLCSFSWKRTGNGIECFDFDFLTRVFMGNIYRSEPYNKPSLDMDIPTSCNARVQNTQHAHELVFP